MTRLPAALLALTLALAGCSTAEPEWATYDSPTGLVEFELPAEPTSSSEPIPGADIEIEVLLAELGDNAWGVAEFPLPPDTPFDLDASVDGALESGLSDLEGQLGESGEILDRTVEEGTFAGTDTRRYAAVFEVGDTTVTYGGVVFVLDDTAVQMISVDRDGDDDDITQRVFDSLTER